MLDALESDHLTRAELAGVLADTGHEITGQALMILLADLELRALVCSGRPAADGTHTYARFADRVPSPRRLDRVEALAELALRYFTGHGPATERDLSYWATLTLGDVRAGLAEVSDQLESFDHDGRTFWHAPADPLGDTAHGARHARPLTCCRSSTRPIAAIRTPGGCSTVPASCRGLVRRRPEWRSSTLSSSRQ